MLTKLQRLKAKDVPQLREQMLRLQNHVCPICQTIIEQGDAVLDHDHETGHIRAALHRQCNQIEGRVQSWCARSGKGVPFVQIIEGILNHITKDYSLNPLHPSHMTAQEREIKRLRKHQKRLKTPQARERIGLVIQTILDSSGDSS